MRNTRPINNTSVERLVQVWAKRYVPDLSTFPLHKGSLSLSQLIEATSKEERAKTVAKVKLSMQTSCECAGIRTDILFSYIPNIVHLSETQRLAQYVWQVYGKALEIYQQQSPLPASFAEVSPIRIGTIDSSSDAFLELAKPALELPGMEQLAMALTPVLQQLRVQHQLARD